MKLVLILLFDTFHRCSYLYNQLKRTALSAAVCDYWCFFLFHRLDCRRKNSRIYIFDLLLKNRCPSTFRSFSWPNSGSSFAPHPDLSSIPANSDTYLQFRKWNDCSKTIHRNTHLRCSQFYERQAGQKRKIVSTDRLWTFSVFFMAWRNTSKSGPLKN